MDIGIIALILCKVMMIGMMIYLFRGGNDSKTSNELKALENQNKYLQAEINNLKNNRV